MLLRSRGRSPALAPCLALTLLGVGAGSVANAGRVVVIPEAQFKIELPKGWQVVRKEKSSDGKTHVASVSSADRKLRVRIRATPNKAQNLKATLQAWEKHVLDMRSVHWKRLDLKESNADGRKVLHAIYVAEMARKTSTQTYHAVVTIAGSNRGVVYVVAGFVDESVYAKRHKELEAVLASFDLLSKDGKTNIKPDPKAPNPKPFTGKMKEVFDQDGGWRLEIPENFLVGNFGHDKKDGKTHRYTARMNSPNRNVRVFVNVKAHAGKTYDFKAHFKRFAARLQKKGHYKSLAEIPALRGSGKEEDGEVHWTGFAGYGVRKATTRAWRLMTAAIHSVKQGKIYTLTVAVEKGAMLTHGGLFTAILGTFAPWGAEVAAANHEQSAGAKAPAASKK